MERVLVCALLSLSLFLSPSLQQDILYPEIPLPNTTSILDSKQNGYNWTIAIIGGFSFYYSYTGPYMMQFAADEINNNPDLIPGVNLKFHYCETYGVDSDAVLASLYEVLEKKVKGIAGGFTSEETVNIQLVSKIFQVPQISARANTDDLSDKTNYPYFARTTMADTIQDNAILKLFSDFGWKKAILIYTNEEYGISGNQAMLNSDNLEIVSVKISTDMPVNYSVPLAQIDKAVHEQGFRVFLYFMLPPNFVAFMNAMNDTYSSSEFSYVMTSPVASNLMETPSKFTSIVSRFDGAILVSAAVGTGPIYEREKPLWDALNATQYQGLRPEPYSFWNWYDTVYVFAHALHSLMDSLGARTNMSVLDTITGAQYFNAIKNVDFYGATGRVVFDSTVNLVADAGIWNLQGGNISYLGTYYSNNSALDWDAKPVFFGGRTTIPPDSYILPLKDTSRAIKIAMGVLTALAIVVTATIAVFLVVRPAAFLKSGKFYCWIIIFGAMLALVAAIIAIPQPTDALCVAYPWFLGIGFMLVYGCLFLRTWALFQVFRAAEQMKKTNLNPVFIMRILGLFIACEAILLIVWTAVDPPKVEIITVGSTHRQHRCSAGNIAFWAVFIGYKGVWMLFGAIISFLVRNVRYDYNQSAGLGMAVYNVFSVTLIAVVLGFILHNTPDVIAVIQVLAILLAFTTTLILLFSRQIWGIMLNKDMETLQETPPGASKTSSGSNAKSGSGERTLSNYSLSAKSKEVELA